MNSATASLSGQARSVSLSGEATTTSGAETEGLDEFAGKVWAWINASSGLVEELDTEVKSLQSESATELHVLTHAVLTG